MEKRRRKLEKILFCAAMIAGLLSGAARANADKTFIELGTDAIPVRGKVWFGAFGENEIKEPVSWIAMETGNVEGNYRLLVSEYLLEAFAFGYKRHSNKWIESEARVFCTSFYEKSGEYDGSAFSKEERTAIAETKKSDSMYQSQSSSLVFGATDDILNGDHVFFLSAQEAEDLFSKDDSRKAKYKDDGENYSPWWLRSPVSESTTEVGIVNITGKIDQYDSMERNCSARPAFNLKRSAVLLSSKSRTDGTDDMYKLTLYDSDRSVRVSDKITRDSETPFIITVPYEINCDPSHMSLVITNEEAAWTPDEGWSSGAKMKSYEAKAVSVTSGNVTFTLPESFDADRDSLKVWLLVQQVNDAQATDYAGKPVDITDEIPHRHAFQYSAGTGAESNTIRAKCTRGCDITEGLSVILNAPENAVYNGQPKAAALNTDYDTTVYPNGPYAIRYCGTGDTFWPESGTAPTDAGTYEASAMVEGKTAKVAFTIEPRSIETAIVRLKEDTLTYNGREQRVYVKDVTLDGVQLMPLCYDAVEETAGKNAGSYKAKVAGKGNYGGVAVAEWWITEKPAVLVVKDSSKVYGEADPGFVATSSGTVGGDKLDYTLTREEGEDAGQYLIRVVPGENPNYIVETTDGILTVKKADAAIAADAKTKRYGEEDPKLTATVTGIIGGDELAYTLTRASGEEVGDYAIAVSPGINRNYNVTAAGAVFTITKADSVIVTPPSAKCLFETGSPQELVTAGTAEGGEMCYALGEDIPSTWSAFIPTATSSGTYIVWYKAAGDEDHLDSTPQKLTAEIIATPDFGPAKLTVPAGAIRKSAFQGDGNVTIVDASRCGEIGANAFESSGISQIRLPKGCAINETAFLNCGTVFVFAPAGGRTETDCKKIENCVFVKEEPVEKTE